MCKYCDVNNYKKYTDGNKILYLDYECYTSLSIVFNPNTNKFSVVAGGEGTAETELNYCPKCGRKLT